MPQIWLTYDELAVLMDCNAAAARALAAALPLGRRRSRDGRTRAKLNGPLTEIFIDRISRERLDRDTTARDAAAYAGKLWALLEQVARSSTRALPAPSPRPNETYRFRGQAFPG
jgi:hypothetical protein